MIPKKTASPTEEDVLRLIKGQYNFREYLVLSQVRSSTGSTARRADALALGLWKSRDLQIHGFEIKTSRTSWLQELSNPEKAEEIGQYCHSWWVVSSDPSIVNPAELPKTWGLYVVEDDSLQKVVAAADLTPRPMDAAFVACLVKAAVGQQASESSAAEMERQYKAGYEKGREEGRRLTHKSTKAVIENLTDRLHDETKSVKEFESMLGLRLSSMNWESVKTFGEVIKEYRLLDNMNRIPPKRVEEMLEAYRFLKNNPVDTVVSKLIEIGIKVSEIRDFVNNKITLLPSLENPDWKARLFLAKEGQDSA